MPGQLCRFASCVNALIWPSLTSPGRAARPSGVDGLHLILLTGSPPSNESKLSTASGLDAARSFT